MLVKSAAGLVVTGALLVAGCGSSQPAGSPHPAVPTDAKVASCLKNALNGLSGTFGCEERPDVITPKVSAVTCTRSEGNVYACETSGGYAPSASYEVTYDGGDQIVYRGG
jgi:hypothetical protein